MTESECLKLTAVHEAAHAALLVLFGLGIRGVSIERDQSLGGFALGPNAESYDNSRPDGFFQMQKHVIMLLAGGEAERAFFPEYNDLSPGDESDVEEANFLLTRISELYHPDFGVQSLEFFREVVREHLGDLRIRTIIADLANELIGKRHMDGREVEDFVKSRFKERFG